MHKHVINAVVAVAVLGSGAVQAQQSPHTFSANIGLFSQYIFRGLQQTNGDPAIQGGLDYSHSSGFYLGTWATNISWLKENATQANGAVLGLYDNAKAEVDFYGGFKWVLTPDVTIDLGTIYYWYSGNVSAAYRALWPAGTDIPKANTWEAYYAVIWKWLSFKLNYSLTNDTFGTADSNGSTYLDLDLVRRIHAG